MLNYHRFDGELPLLWRRANARNVSFRFNQSQTFVPQEVHSRLYIYIYIDKLQRFLEPTAHLSPQRGSLMDSQSKPRRNVINYREFRGDQGRTTLWMTFSLEEKLFVPWAGFEPTSPWLPVGCDHHYTIRATMLATWPIWIVSGNFLRGTPGLVFFSN